MISVTANRFVFPAATVFAATVLAAGIAWAQPVAPGSPSAFSRSGVREIEARPGETLRLDLDTGGSIRVEGWAENRVRVEAETEGVPNVTIRVERYREGVSVVVRRSGAGNSARGVPLLVRVPSRFDLNLVSRGGNFSVVGLEGEIAGETYGGDVLLERIEGTVEVSTQGGNVRIEDSSVDGRAKTYGGNIHLGDVRGTVECTTLGGNIIFKDVAPPVGGANSQPIRLDTQGGNIVVPSAPNGLDAETLGGNIEVGSIGRSAKLKTMGGNIVVADLSGELVAKTTAGNVTVRASSGKSGSREIRLTSHSGSIQLTLPADAAVDAEIELRYTKNSRKNYSIRSDFALETEESPNWDYDQGTPVKRIRGRGRSQGSGERFTVHIEAVNGDVHLLRER